MADFPLTTHQLRFEVDRVRRMDSDALVIGLHADGPWRGEDEVNLGDRRYAVVRADSALEFREALAGAEADDRPTVVLTALDQAELGHDVVARLARSKLWPVDPWEGVKGLFRARQLDPSLRESCLAQALLEHQPPGLGYDPVPAGVLDAGTAWRAIYRHALKMEDREPDLPGLLLWAAEADAGGYLGSPADLRAATRARLAATLGAAAVTILDIVESGASRDALALTLVFEVVFSESGADEPALRAAAARLERFHRHRPIEPDTARTLARAGHDALDDLARDDPARASAHQLRADNLLRDVGATPQAHLGSRTPLTWESRLRRLAVTLAEKAEVGDLTACEEGLRLVAGHALAGQAPYQDRLERAGMALRLARWLRTPEAVEGSFAQLARRYAEEVAFVDWASDSLAGGDELPELSDAFGRIGRAAADRRAGFSRAFAVALADWTASGSDPGAVLRVEDVAARAVGAVMESRTPVLLIVMDGMSWPVARELLADLRRQHWVEAMLPGAGGPPPPVVAAIPSVTELSRMSLLAGYLHRGDQGVEKRLFPSNPGLQRGVERNHPPLIFHKGQLTRGGRGALDDAVVRAIAEPRNRVVAAVINAVDDRLAGASQVRDAWTVEAIRPLGSLLRAARESGRVVILASDHGHVWHRDAPITRAEDASARWHPADGPARDGEILLEGGRVRGPGDAPRLIAAWSEEIRFGTARNGYHGGASPREMVAPLVILADATAREPTPEPCVTRPLPWWDGPGEVRRAEAAPAIAPLSPPRTRAPAGYLPFGEPNEDEPHPPPAAPLDERPPAVAGWLGQLVGSETYRAQRQAVRKFAPEDGAVVRALAALVGRGGSMSPVALARAVGQPALRIDGFVAKLQRLLNVDGYDVVRLDRQRDLVELDEALLRRQFDLE
jgi:PglZ domain